MPTTPAPQPAQDPRTRRANVRTALVLLSIAVVFFFGIVFAKYMGEGSTGMTVLGAAVLLFLLVAIGRNILRK
jgi:hypothetical protein